MSLKDEIEGGTVTETEGIMSYQVRWISPLVGDHRQLNYDYLESAKTAYATCKRAEELENRVLYKELCIVKHTRIVRRYDTYEVIDVD